MKLLLLFCLCLSSTWVSPLKMALAKRNIGGRVIGGQPARSGQFPYTSALQITTADGRYFCGGTLVSGRWIVTAAQCLVGATTITIKLGSNSLTAEDPNRITLATSDYVIHPDFDPLTLSNDIGLVELRSAIQFSGWAQPVYSLPSGDAPTNARAAVVGWGQTSDDDPGLADELQYVDVTTLSNIECRITYGNQVTDNMICVDGNFNEGACLGDIGSPLVLVVQAFPQLLAVSSFVSGNGCETPDPSGYTKVHPYVDWIKNVTNERLTTLP